MFWKYKIKYSVLEICAEWFGFVHPISRIIKRLLLFSNKNIYIFCINISSVNIKNISLNEIDIFIKQSTLITIQFLIDRLCHIKRIVIILKPTEKVQNYIICGNLLPCLGVGSNPNTFWAWKRTLAEHCDASKNIHIYNWHVRPLCEGNLALHNIYQTVF